MDIDIKRDKDNKVQMAVLLFNSGKKCHLDDGELAEIQAMIDKTDQIGTDGLKFTCPASGCDGNRLECIEDGQYNSEVLCIDEEGDFDFGEINASGQVVRFQCLTCGEVLMDGTYAITEHDEVVEWIKEKNAKVA